MRILKYLFLLLLLSLVASSIFIATQKGNFTVEKSKIINSPKSVVYNYVNDTKNFVDWNSIAKEDSLLVITPGKKSVGLGSFLTWNGAEESGNLKTTHVKANDSISQNFNFNDNSATMVMHFKDTLGKTKVTWKATGEMDFLYKITNSFNGGAAKALGLIFEKSLVHLNKKLDNEMNTFTTKVDGLVNKTEVFYLAQTFTSEFSKVTTNSRVVFSKISKFCKKNNIIQKGKPFVIYHTYDTIKNTTKISICIPIKDAIFLTEGSDISSKTLPAFQAIKTTLVGDYSHNKQALDKTRNYIKTKKHQLDEVFSHLEIYTIGKNEIKNPSKWTTEIYFPLKQRKVVKPVIKAQTLEVVPEETAPATTEEQP